MTIYLVRHAHAGSRSQWAGPDSERPLSDKGRRQAEAVTEALASCGVTRVLSSGAVRCQQTVAPLADRCGVPVEVHLGLAEGAKVKATTALIGQLAADGVSAALSSHGDVIPAAVDALARRGVEVKGGRGLPKGTYFALTVDGDGAVASAKLIDPRP